VSCLDTLSSNAFGGGAERAGAARVIGNVGDVRCRLAGYQ